MRSRWHRSGSGHERGDAWIMGVLNCTPDSFSDGGQYINTDAAVAHGLAMWNEGASLIDVGGESTRPGATVVSTGQELKRVIPVVQQLSEQGCAVSIDTMKADVMAQAVDAGAVLVNDVSALGFDERSMAVVADAGVDVCLMHMKGDPKTMQSSPQYDDVVEEVIAFFTSRIEAAYAAGISESSILLDPGIGFGKRLQDNLALIQSLDVLKRRFGMPILLGVSRKSFLGALTESSAEDRELETAVAGAVGILHGADMLRVHDVRLQKRAVRVASALS